MDQSHSIKPIESMLKNQFNPKISHLTARKSHNFYTPLLKSNSSTKFSQISDEIKDEVLVKRRISKLSDVHMVIILEKAIDILMKPSEKRNLEEIFHLIKATEKLDFFAKMKKNKEFECFNPNSLNFKCCKALKYEYFSKGDTVFFQGDTADKFFIIIKGKASVLLQKDSKIMEGEKQALKNLRRNRIIPDYIQKYKSQPEIIKKNEEKQLIISQDEINSEKKGMQNKEIQKKFRKGIAKVSNALLFLKTIEKSTESTKSEAFLSASLPSFDKTKGVSIEKQPENKSQNKEKKFEIPLNPTTSPIKPEPSSNNKKPLIHGLENKDLKNKDLLFEEGVFKYNVIQTYQNGDVFGELGIIRKKKRAATIVCLENTHLAVLLKKDYESILLEQESIKLIKLIEFFYGTLFKKCSRDRMTYIAYMYKKRMYLKDQILFKEGQEPIECYIVKKGDIELSKNIKEGKIEKKGKVAILSTGQFFGEEEILKNREIRKYTAKVISVKASVFFITKQNFRKILNEYSDIEKLFKTQAKNKEIWHSTKLQQISHLLFSNEAFLKKINRKKAKKSKAPIRTTIDQLDLFCKENHENHEIQQIPQKTPIIAFQNSTLRSQNGQFSFRKTQETLNEKELYHQETHQVSKLVRANQLTLNALLKKKKINMFELYEETKNLHHPNDLKYLMKHERIENFEVYKEKSSIVHKEKTLQNLELLAKNENHSNEFLSFYTPIRKLSLPGKSSHENNSNEIYSTRNKKMNLIKTYEYFCDPMKKKCNFAENMHLRTFSLNSHPEKTKEKFVDLSVGNASGRDMMKNKQKKFLKDETVRRNRSNSIVVLNHMGKPIKFSNNFF